MIDEVIAIVIRPLRLGKNGHRLYRGVDLLLCAGKSHCLVREGRSIFADLGWGVARRIDSDEDRHQTIRKFGMFFDKQIMAAHHFAHIERADIGAPGIAEIDHLPLAREILRPDRLSGRID